MDIMQKMQWVETLCAAVALIFAILLITTSREVLPALFRISRGFRSLRDRLWGDRRAFNKFFAAVLVHELGDKNLKALPRTTLVKLMPCSPAETDSIIAELSRYDVLEIIRYTEGEYVFLGVMTEIIFDQTDWRRAQKPQDRARFEQALDQAKQKLQAAA